MAKRYYLCDLIGDGSINNPYRPAVANLGVNYVAEFPPQDPQTGQYLGATCLVLVSTNDHARVKQLNTVDELPDVSLDVEWNAVDRSRRNQAEAALARRGLQRPSVSPGNGTRVFIRGIGRMLNPNFNEDNFDVSD